MNVLDSELVLGQLREGYELTRTASGRRGPAQHLRVRQHAEEKVCSRLGEVRKAKQKGGPT